MDYVPSHGNTANLADRDNISGARAFDGEDQGKVFSLGAGMIMRCLSVLGVNCFEFLGYGNRYRMQQLQQ